MANSRRTQRLQERVDSIQKWYLFCSGFLVVMYFLMYFLCAWLAKNVFSYVVTEEEVKREAYEHPIGGVYTEVCYTTNYGDCYHAEYCGYLKSQHRTTVYEAKKAGYRSCSRCTPTESVYLTLTETRYHDVTYTKQVEKQPTLLLCGIGYGLLVLFHLYVVRPMESKKEEAKKELELSIEQDNQNDQKLLTT